MSLLSENIIPGKHGTTFGTDAKSSIELHKILQAIATINGVRDVIFNTEKFPREFTVRTTRMIKVSEIQSKIKAVGYHAIPTGFFLFW
ncbi:MAG: heavy-metal-associated domain-containing protein [Crocinitomicaceae bacterium]